MIAVFLAIALAADPPPLTLDDALRQAVAHQPTLQSAKHQREAAAAGLTVARSIEYPYVHADAQAFASTDNGAATAYLSPTDFVRVGTRPGAETGLSDFTPFASGLAGVGAHYDVLDFGYTRGTVGAAEAQVSAADASADQTLQDVLLRVTTAYYGALAAQEALAVAEASEKRALEHDALARAGVQSGLKPPIDLPRSQAEVQAARLGVIRTQNALQVSRANLDVAIGWTPPGPYGLAPPAPDARPIPESPAADSRADLTALRDQEQGLELQRVAASSGNWPRLLATGSLTARAFDGPPTTLNYDIGLVLTLPLFTGFAVTGQVAQLDALLADLHAREDALKAAIGYQLRQSRGTLLSAREAIRASQAEVGAAQASLSLAEGRYKQGLGNIVELTDAEAQLDAAQLGLVQSQFDASVSRAQLDYALGALRVP